MNISLATCNEIAALVELDRRHFHPVDLVDEEVLRSWQCKNDAIFTVIRSDHQVLGYYSLLPLELETLGRIIDGSLREKDIRPKDILSKSQAKYCEALYFFSVATRHRYSRATLLLFQHLQRHLEMLVSRGRLNIVYAIAATPEGERLLKKLGFQKIKDSSERPDRRPLYSRNLSLVREGRESIFARKL